MSDYFPPELIEKIMLKLPAKSLIRFTTVCKSWRSIITSPFFISSYLYKPQSQTLLLRSCDNDAMRERYSLLEVDESELLTVNSSLEIETPLSLPKVYFRLMGFSRGVVCAIDDIITSPKRPIVLWNPSVKKYVVLPYATIDPKKSYCFAVGFGFADNDFKVVRFVYYDEPDDSGSGYPPPTAEVFTLKTGRWRRLVIGVDVRYRIYDIKWPQVLLNGVVHWLGYDAVSVKTNMIVVFRLAQELFDEIRLPNELAIDDFDHLSLRLIGESLAVIKHDSTLGNEPCDVWLMEEYGVESSWTRLHRFFLVQGMDEVVAFRKKGEALMASRGIGLVAFDIEKLEIKNLGIQGPTDWFYIYDYVESLELLRCGLNAAN